MGIKEIKKNGKGQWSDIRTRKGAKVPKGKYEVVKAIGKFATLLSWDKRDTYHMVNIDVLQKYAKGL